MGSKGSMRIDLNLDAGESAEMLADGREESLYRLVSSVNVACGGHAGDDGTMSRAIELALKHGLAIGAHPSYPDREGFGRRVPKMERAKLVDSLAGQIAALRAIAERAGAELSHVKPHGALYNQAAFDREAALAVFEAVRAVDSTLTVVGLAGSDFLAWARAEGLAAIGEGFADRRYEADGRLRARAFDDALIANESEAAAQAVKIARGEAVAAAGGGSLVVAAKTICVHGDSPDSLKIARAVRDALDRAGIAIKAVGAR